MKKCIVNQKYEILAPDHIADWDAPTMWEVSRFASMEKHLKKTDILYDIGAEQGWQSAVYAKYFTDNMVLVEPVPQAWPNIKQTWEANGLKTPLGCFQGLFGNKTDLRGYVPIVWPDSADGELQVALGYQSLVEHGHVVPQMKLDDYVKLTGIVPDALSIDVEGSEHEVLKGSEQTLKEHHPQLFVSVHPEMLFSVYKSYTNDLVGFVKGLGYEYELLGFDHEMHFRFYQ